MNLLVLFKHLPVCMVCLGIKMGEPVACFLSLRRLSCVVCSQWYGKYSSPGRERAYYIDCTFFLEMYATYVRPILEYCSQVWSPPLKQNIDRIESVQIYFTRLFYDDVICHI